MYEHSDYYSYTEKQESIKLYQKALLERQGYYLEEIENDPEYNDMTDVEKIEFAKSLSDYEASCIMTDVSDILFDTIGSNMSINEYKGIINHVINEMRQETELNEDSLAPGHDMTFWANDMGWVGKLCGGLLTAAFAGMVALIMAGKDKAAMKALERYMNKLVERVDDGIHKKKSLMNKLFGRFGVGTHDGDQSKACLRQIQENFSKKIACDAMILTKSMGFLPSHWNSAIKDLESNTFNNGGMAEFIETVSIPVSKLSNKI